MQGDHQRLMQTLERFFDLKGYKADLATLKQLSVTRLVDRLTMALPFDAAGKQVLLESVEPELRLANFIALIDGDFGVPDFVTRH